MKRTLFSRMSILFIFFLCNYGLFMQALFPRMILTLFYILGMTLAFIFSVQNLKIRTKKAHRFISLLVVGVIIYFALRVVAQFLFDSYTSVTVTVAGQTIIPFFIFFIALNMSQKDVEYCNKLFVAFAVSSIVLGWIDQVSHVFSFANIRNELVIINGVANNRGYSMAGYSLGTGWIAGFAFAFLLEKKLRGQFKIMDGAFLGITICGSLLTYSRGAFFFVLLIVAIEFALFRLNKGVKISKKELLIAFGVLLLTIVGFAVGYQALISTSFFNRYANNPFSVFEGSNSLRYGLQMRALQMALSFPVFGKGFGFVGGQAVEAMVPNAFWPESTLFMVWIEGGIVALLLILLIIAVSVKRSNKNCSKAAYLAIVGAALAWSIMSTTLEGDLTAASFWYCVGCINNTNLNVPQKSN